MITVKKIKNIIENNELNNIIKKFYKGKNINKNEFIKLYHFRDDIFTLKYFYNDIEKNYLLSKEVFFKFYNNKNIILYGKVLNNHSKFEGMLIYNF